MPASIKSKKKESITFSLKAVELLDFSMNHPQKPLIDNKLFHFDIKLEHKLNNENKLLISVIYIDLFNEKRDLKLGTVVTSCVFEIANFSDFVDTVNNKINFPDDFLVTINAITISTARGVMFSQFRGTYLHNALLPILDPKSFMIQK
jgi:hypothetical protein